MYLNQDIHPGNLQQQESHGWVSLDTVRDAGEGVPTKEECIAGGAEGYWSECGNQDGTVIQGLTA